MPPDPAIDFLLTAVKNFGPTGALMVVGLWGGRVFMALARKFAEDVVRELRDIREAIHGNERRVDGLIEKVAQVAGEVRDQGNLVAALSLQIAGSNHKSPPR